MQHDTHDNLTKNVGSFRLLLPLVLLAVSALLLSACGLKVGDVKSVSEANDLAIACKTDEALAALDKAVQAGGIGEAIADLDRVAILRDAGRTAEADTAMAQRHERWKADAENKAKSEEAVNETVEKIRGEREKRTGRRTCD